MQKKTLGKRDQSKASLASERLSKFSRQGDVSSRFTPGWARDSRVMNKGPQRPPPLSISDIYGDVLSIHEIKTSGSGGGTMHRLEIELEDPSPTLEKLKANKSTPEYIRRRISGDHSRFRIPVYDKEVKAKYADARKERSKGQKTEGRLTPQQIAEIAKEDALAASSSRAVRFSNSLPYVGKGSVIGVNVSSKLPEGCGSKKRVRIMGLRYANSSGKSMNENTPCNPENIERFFANASSIQLAEAPDDASKHTVCCLDRELDSMLRFVLSNDASIPIPIMEKGDPASQKAYSISVPSSMVLGYMEKHGLDKDLYRIIKDHVKDVVVVSAFAMKDKIEKGQDAKKTWNEAKQHVFKLFKNNTSVNEPASKITPGLKELGNKTLREVYDNSTVRAMEIKVSFIQRIASSVRVDEETGEEVEDEPVRVTVHGMLFHEQLRKFGISNPWAAGAILPTIQLHFAGFFVPNAANTLERNGISTGASDYPMVEEDNQEISTEAMSTEDPETIEQEMLKKKRNRRRDAEDEEEEREEKQEEEAVVENEPVVAEVEEQFVPEPSTETQIAHDVNLVGAFSHVDVDNIAIVVNSGIEIMPHEALEHLFLFKNPETKLLKLGPAKERFKAIQDYNNTKEELLVDDMYAADNFVNYQGANVCSQNGIHSIYNLSEYSGPVIKKFFKDKPAINVVGREYFDLPKPKSDAKDEDEQEEEDQENKVGPDDLVPPYRFFILSAEESPTPLADLFQNDSKEDDQEDAHEDDGTIENICADSAHIRIKALGGDRKHLNNMRQILTSTVLYKNAGFPQIQLWAIRNNPALFKDYSVVSTF